MLPVIEKALFSRIQIERSRDKCQGHKSARPRAICSSLASPVTRSVAGGACAALQKSKVGTRTWAPDRLQPSAPDGRAGRPCPPEARWHGVGRAGTASPGPGDLWSEAGPTCTGAMAVVLLGAGPPVTLVSVCALFVPCLCPVFVVSAVNTQ